LAEEQPPLSDEEIRRQLEDELRRVSVSDLLVQTIYTVSSLGYRRLTPEDRDLDQARLAIDTIGALVPLLEGLASAELMRDFNQVKANMQLAYAAAVAAPEATADERTESEGKDDGDS
jgi:hypothetical protein